MNPCKFRIAIIFSQQNRVFFCNSSSFSEYLPIPFLLLNLRYTLRFKTMLFVVKQKCFLQSNNSGSSGSIFWVKARTVFYTFLLLRLYHRRFSILPHDLLKIKSNILHCFIDSNFCGIITCKSSFWFMLSIWCCTSEINDGNFVNSIFANVSFNSSSPKVLTKLQQSRAAIRIFKFKQFLLILNRGISE